MHRASPFISLLCILLLVSPTVYGEKPDSNTLPPHSTPGIDNQRGFLARLTRNYRAIEPPPISLSNSNRIESLLRAGKLYLSLQDTIALALENNLDIEIQRYGPQIADADVMRAQAGGLLRGVPTSVASGPSSAAGQPGAATGITQSAASQANQNTGGGTVITSTGTNVPNLDPVLTGFLQWGHNTNPQTSSFVTGTNTLITRRDLTNFGFQQGFLTGTTVSIGLNNSYVHSTQLRNELNPSTNASFNMQITQRLLQGFGVAVNNRLIRVAKNNREITDLVFKQQVITTVSAIVNLYWDLVSFNEDVKVKQQNLAASEKLYNDNKKQVEIGTLAPIEIVRAEAEVASRQQDLTISETQVLQQETLLKNALSRTGIASPSVAEARIVTTDVIRIPDTEAIEPMQDMVAGALRSRPEVSQRRIQLENSRINLKGSRSQLLPSLDAVATVANNALAGDVNSIPLSANSGVVRSLPNNFFIGGYGTVLTQLFSRNFPDYSAGFQLNIPLRNRSARADMVRDQLSLRQAEIGLQQLENQIRVDVQNAIISLQQARARYQAATKARILQEQTLDAEQKKYALGASTIYNVILVQRDLAQQQSAEVAARSNYSKARVEIDRATGETLRSNNISVEEAFRGSISRPPSPLPAVP